MICITDDSLANSPLKEQENEDDDLGNDEEDPLYDRVPSDEDYASVASESSSTVHLPTSDSSKTLKTNDNKQIPLNVTIHSSKPLLCPATSSCSSNMSNKHSTPSPSGPRLKEHKILTTNFDRPPVNLNDTNSNSGNSSSLVANAESALNSIINSLNQIDYSHLDNNEQNNQYMHITEKEMMQAMIERLMEENAQLRAEKMLATATNMSKNGLASPNIHNYYTNDDISLYSTVKNKKQMPIYTNYASPPHSRLINQNFKNSAGSINSMSNPLKQSITNRNYENLAMPYGYNNMCIQPNNDGYGIDEFSGSGVPFEQ